MSDQRPTRPIPLPTLDDLGDRRQQYDYPPASGHRSPYPYPDRLLRLNRALRNTADLSGDMDESASSPSDRETQTTAPSRRRRFSLIDDEQLSPHLQYSSEFMSSVREPRGTVPRADHTRPTVLPTASSRNDDSSSQRPAKRMRCETSNPVSFARPPILYGRYGQVEPGSLRMELISCDGGEMVDHRSPQVYLGYQNVLKSDKSVYCSSRKKASMVMRHADTTPFCIDKLHVIAPENGFDAPVATGQIYIAMNLDDLKKYQESPFHAQLSDKNPGSEARHRRRLQRLREMHADNQLSLQEALRDPEIAAFYYHQATTPLPLSISMPNNDWNYDPVTGQPVAAYLADPLKVPWIQHEGSGTPLMPDNAATIHSFDDVLTQDTSSPSVLEYRNQRQHTRTRLRAGLFPGEPYLPFMAPANEHPSDDSTRQTGRASQTGQGQSSHTEQPSDRKGCESDLLPYKDPNVTFVRFEIEDGKSSVTIKFEPQVSGRFILLNLSAQGCKGNVDVQSIVVSGFAGPRFFPATEAR